jgi:GT2 family glycosyltransferase
MTTKYSISILAMNGLEMTKRCVESVLRHSPPGEFELFLTSNGARDGTVEYFLNLRSPNTTRIVVFTHLENIGFVKGHNQAFADSQGQYFIALNNDTEVPEGWLKAMEEPFLKDHLCAITGVEGSPCSIAVQEPVINQDGTVGQCALIGYAGEFIEYIDGACLMVRRKAIPAGEPLFATCFELVCCEDTDLSFRVRAQGWSIRQVELEINHLRSATIKDIPDIGWIILRNQAKLKTRWLNYLGTVDRNPEDLKKDWATIQS